MTAPDPAAAPVVVHCKVRANSQPETHDRTWQMLGRAYRAAVVPQIANLGLRLSGWVAAEVEEAAAEARVFDAEVGRARNDLQALAQAAVAHAQVETIHPSPDGDGRVGHALVQAMLRTKGVTRSVSIPFSAGLLTDTRGYFQALTASREGDPEGIVITVARATLLGVANGRGLLPTLMWSAPTGTRSWRE